MSSLRTLLLLHPKRSVSLIAIVILFFCAVVLLASAPQSAHAGGAIGNGGGAGGSGGGAQTRNGWGWFTYSVDGNPQPYWFRDGSTKWPEVSQACKNVSADQVIAFIILSSDVGGSDGARGVVYKYITGDYFTPAPYRGYMGNSGGSWLTVPAANDRFNTLSAADKVGWTFGENVAWFCYDSTPNNWNITPSTTVNKVTAGPGDTITWTHRVDSTGPDPTAENVAYNYNNKQGMGSGTGRDNSWYLPGGSGTGGTSQKDSTHVVTQGDVGKNLCRSTSVAPRSGADASGLESGDSCVSVSYDYTLTPAVSTDISDVIEPNTTVNVTPSVRNSGPTKSKSTQWQITQMIVLPKKAIPHAGSASRSPSGQSPCGNYFKSADATCSTVKNGTTVFDENGGVLSGDVLAASPALVADLAVGTRVCFALSVQPYSSSSDEWSHSAPLCLTVGKKPKVQVHGGDLSVGKLFTGASQVSHVQTSLTVKGSATFGSWIEYGIFASGTITGAGSGSAYAGTAGLASATTCLASTLSFTNFANSPCDSVGKYVSVKAMPNVALSFPGGATIAGSSVAPNSLTTGTYVSGDVTLTASMLAPGQTIIIKSTGTVTVADDQKYNPDNNGAKYTSVSQLPQLVIIANKIIINSNVKNVDAWLIANGTNGVLETCDTGAPYVIANDAQKLTSDKCKEPLMVNGPVMAKELWLRRTAGSGTGLASGDPAEVFNLRPDAYLWASTRATGTGRIQTVYTTELPPRL